ncbi:hypothetical protein TNCV_2307231 [Trichonephila clavipes]|nr:hypothetical protein TNCV_2307231 [Trichonephila clavipes]
MTVDMLVNYDAYPDHQTTFTLVIRFDNVRWLISTPGFCAVKNTSRVAVQTKLRLSTEKNPPQSSSVQDRCSRQHVRRPFLQFTVKRMQIKGIWHTSHLHQVSGRLLL